MNIFFLSKDPYEAATMMYDKHVVKMVVETAQLLSTAHRILDGDDKFRLNDAREEILYRCTHRNHPSAVWARTSVENYNWLVDHLDGLLHEYTHRYNKRHKTQRLLHTLSSPPLNLKAWDWTTPPSCMPDHYVTGDYVSNYRKYYQTDKAYLRAYKNRQEPEWLMELHD